ncbi:MAG: hypothetical protein L0Z62_32635 [Gemmataceae bacterium]|nr:hypothetical protein [Gemmataceae bacterium]
MYTDNPDFNLARNWAIAGWLLTGLLSGLGLGILYNLLFGAPTDEGIALVRVVVGGVAGAAAATTFAAMWASSSRWVLRTGLALVTWINLLVCLLGVAVFLATRLDGR